MANESPKCPKCGFVMVEDFEYRRVNEHADIAIPLQNQQHVAGLAAGASRALCEDPLHVPGLASREDTLHGSPRIHITILRQSLGSDSHLVHACTAAIGGMIQSHGCAQSVEWSWQAQPSPMHFMRA